MAPYSVALVSLLRSSAAFYHFMSDAAELGPWRWPLRLLGLPRRVASPSEPHVTQGHGSSEGHGAWILLEPEVYEEVISVIRNVSAFRLRSVNLILGSEVFSVLKMV